ncbi:hypothetical protein ACKVMT_04460 [Halobacteriales archaeon Cl-PHB]
MATDLSPARAGVLAGLVLGAGLGAVAGILNGVDFALTIGYGVGGGIVVGAFAGRLVRANRGQSHLPLRIVGGAVVLGVVVGAFVGTVAAWGFDESMLKGLGVGAGLGVVHGLLLGGVLLDAAGFGTPAMD